MNLKYSFLPPVYSDLETTQKASFLHYTFLVIAVAFLAFGILNLGWGATSLGVTLLVFSGICLIGFYLNKAKRYYPAAILLTVIIYIGIFFNLIDGAAFHDPGVAALPIFVILTGILFRKTQIPILTILTILGLTAIYCFWSSDLLVLNKPPTQGRLMILSIIQVVSGALTWMIISAQSEIIGELDLSEERFQSLFMAAPIGIGVTSRDGSVLVYNESLIRMGGWNPDEFKQLNVQDYYANPQDRIKMLSILEAAGVVRGYETQFLRKDKGIFDVSMSVIPLKYGDEDGFLTIIEDISNRKQAELERQEELEFRRLLVDSSPIFFTVVDKQGKITMMNKSMLGALGYKLEDVLGLKYITSFLPKQDQHSGKKVMEELFLSGKNTKSENHLITKTGQELLVEWYACPIVNPEEKIEFIFAYGVDITDRKKAEIALKESSERHRVFFEESPLLNWQFNIHPPMPIDLPIDKQIDWILHKSQLSMVNEGFIQSLRGPLDIRMEATLYENWGSKEDHGRVTVREFINQGYSLKMYETLENTVHGDLAWSIINCFGVIENNHLIRIWGTTMDISDRKQSEVDLRESEEKFHKVFMESPYAITIARQEDGVFTDINKYFENNFGYSREEIIGRSALDLGLVKDPKALEKGDQILTQEGRARDIELSIIRKDGSEVIHLASSGIIELAGEPHRLSIGKDITDRKKAEEALMESDTQNRLILDSLPIAFYRAHPADQYGGTWVSEQIDQIVGFSPEEMLGLDFWSARLHPEDRQMALRAFDGLEETKTLEIEYRWQRSDGEYIWLQDSAVLVSDDEGNPQEIIGTWIDVSDRKKSEQVIQESETRYRTLFENANDAIFILREDKIITCNNSAETMFGFTKKEMVGKHSGEISPLIQPDGKESTFKAEALSQKAREGIPQLFEWVHQRKDGSEFPTEVNLHQSIIQNEVLTMAVIRDITERKREEEAAQEERQRLARDLHDAVSQTLFSASMIAQTLERSWDRDPESVRPNLVELQILTKGALAEMRTLLFELRPTALENTLMTELLQQLVDGFSGRSMAEIDLSISGENPLPYEIRVTFFRLVQAAFSNIIKHARAGHVQVSYDSQTNGTRIIIEDDGQGFDPTSTSTGQHGLSIMRERANSINAEMNIVSEIGDGTKVEVFWQDK